MQIIQGQTGGQADISFQIGFKEIQTVQAMKLVYIGKLQCV